MKSTQPAINSSDQNKSAAEEKIQSSSDAAKLAVSARINRGRIRLYAFLLLAFFSLVIWFCVFKIFSK